MKRRAFLSRLGAAAVGLASCRLLPGIVPPALPKLAPPPALVLVDKEIGLSIRYIKHWDWDRGADMEAAVMLMAAHYDQAAFRIYANR